MLPSRRASTLTCWRRRAERPPRNRGTISGPTRHGNPYGRRPRSTGRWSERLNRPSSILQTFRLDISGWGLVSFAIGTFPVRAPPLPFGLLDCFPSQPEPPAVSRVAISVGEAARVGGHP